jgi:peptide methionine sulfoxide reductase MsrA
VKNPSYEQVCSGRTGHAESIQIKFDPKVIGLEKVLDIFWRTHDPTTLTGRVTTLGHNTVLQSFIMTRSRKKLLKSRKVQLKTKEPTKLQSLQKLRHTMTFMLQRIITRITTKTIKMLHISILL